MYLQPTNTLNSTTKMQLMHTPQAIDRVSTHQSFYSPEFRILTWQKPLNKQRDQNELARRSSHPSPLILRHRLQLATLPTAQTHLHHREWRLR